MRKQLYKKSVAILVAVGVVSSYAGAVTLKERVAADFEGKSGDFYHYAVPPMSDVQRLADAYTVDGTPGGSVNIVAAKDEFEPGSFLVWANKDLGKVSFTLSEFKNENGDVFPAEDLDLKFIKVWYQNKNGWFSYFGDTDFKLCPELLLNDEDLIRVDTEKKANYARLVNKKGEKSEHWLNPPRQLNSRSVGGGRSTERFHCMREDFRDAATLQPVNLPKNEFKNFFLTVHTKKDTKPGLYKGVVKLASKNGKALGEIPVAIRVLDFELPQPKCYVDPKKDFLVSAYSYISFNMIREVNGYDNDAVYKQMVAVLKNQVEHNQTIHWVRGNMNNEAYQTGEAMREAGMRMDVFVGMAGCFGVKPEAQTNHASRIVNELCRRYGHNNAYIGFGDEPGPGWLVKNRPTFENYQREGLKFILAGGNHIFFKNGYLYDWHNMSDDATSSKTPDMWNSIGNHNRSAWYAVHHIGTEDPSYNRRANGLGAYLSGYTALCNYAHHFGPYNDDTTTYKPMVYAYGSYDGVIDTLAWEGFREGIDDIRYATLMTDLARKAQKSSDIKVRYLGGKAMQYLTMLDRKSFNMDATRGEMIRYIIELSKVVSPYAVESDMKFDPAVAKARANRAEENLAKALKKAQEDFDAKIAAAKYAAGKNAAVTNKYHESVAKIYSRYMRGYEGGKYLEEKGLYGAAFGYYDEHRDDLVRLAKKVFADTNLVGQANGRGTAFWILASSDPDFTSKFREVYFAGIPETKTNQWKQAVRKMMKETFGKKRSFVGKERYEAFIRIYENDLMPLALKWGEARPYDFARNAFESYMMLGRYADAVKAARDCLDNTELSPLQKYRLGLFVEFAEFNGSKEKTFKKLKKYDEAFGKDVSNKDRVAIVRALGALIQGISVREEVVRGIEQYRESLYVQTPKKRYQVKFSDKLITGVDDLEKFPAEMTVYDRTYGGNMDFLVTDVASGERADVGKSKEKLEPPEMKIVADKRGLHILVVVKDPKADGMEMGFVGAGSFEGYIAPGENEPYASIMINPVKNSVSFFNTLYSTFGHRRLTTEENSRKYKLDHVFRNDRFLSYLFLSWEAWPERAPKNGSIWDFENIYWNRTGSFCWNGTETIHGRSTWGELEFSLTDEQRAEILKILLARAYASFKTEKVCRGSINGEIPRWNDAEIGDIEFYKAEVEPLVKELTELGKRLTKDMDANAVIELAEEALPRWHNIAFEIQRRRARWLERKMAQ